MSSLKSIYDKFKLLSFAIFSSVRVEGSLNKSIDILFKAFFTKFIYSGSIMS